MFTKVNETVCTGCGLCVRACPKALISMQDDKAFIKDDECFECGHCAALCPADAIEYEWTKAQIGDKIVMPDFETVERVVHARRSVRKFKNEAVDKALLTKLMTFGSQAPTGSNRQGLRYIVTSPEMTQKLEELAQKQAPHSVEYIKESAARKLDGITLGAPHIICLYAEKELGAFNAALAGATMDLAAQPLGLGFCYNGILLRLYNESKEMQRLLPIPQDMRMYMMISVGYADNEKYLRQIIRPDPDITFA